MSNNKEKIGKAVFGVGYLFFALKYTVFFSLISLAVLYPANKPLWIAPISGIIIFMVYRTIRRLFFTGLIEFGRKSTNQDNK